jgi:O-antigen/teichoic acid export membrane protein
MAQRSNSFAVFTATGRILAMLAGFVMPLFLTRFLSQENYGLYNQFYVLLGFTGSIFSFGMQSNLYYYYPGSDKPTQKALIGNTLLTMIFLSLIAVIFLVVPQLTSLFIKSEQLLPYAYLIGVCIFFYIPTQLLFPLFVIKGDKKNSVIFPPAEAIIRVVFVVVAALVYKSLKAIFIAIIIYHTILFVITIFYSYIPIREIKGRLFNWDLLKQQLVYVVPFGLAVVLSTLLRQFDKMVCISFITPEEYAIYALAFFGVPGINQIYDSVGEVYILNMSSAYKERDYEKTVSFYQEYVWKLLSFSVPIILIVSLFAPSFFELLFPERYMASIPFFRIYILSFIIGALGAGLVLRASGKTRYTLRAYLLSAPFYLIFTYFSIKYYGTWGAITSAMLGIVLPKAFQMIFEMRLLEKSFSKYLPWKKLGKIVLISVVFLLPVFTITLFYTIHWLWVIILSTVYVLSVYFYEIKHDLFIVTKESLASALLSLKNKLNSKKHKE